MRLPRPQFTVRRLMLAVAIVGFVLGVTIERQNRFRKIEAHHQAEFANLVSRSPYISFSNFSEAVNRRLDWHETMRLKYEHAALHPWLPVSPDPSEPE
jgi:hypothetical protein